MYKFLCYLIYIFKNSNIFAIDKTINIILFFLDSMIIPLILQQKFIAEFHIILSIRQIKRFRFYANIKEAYSSIAVNFSSI